MHKVNHLNLEQNIGLKIDDDARGTNNTKS